MTVLLFCGRTLSKQAIPRSTQLFTRLSSTNCIARVSRAQNTDSAPRQSQCSRPASILFPWTTRTYATGTTTKPAGRPKGHTGRTAAKRSAATKNPATKKPAVKKPAGRKRATAKRAKAKPKAKPKPKKRVLSESAQRRQASKEQTALRKKALLRGAPKRLPESSWQVCFVEHAPKKGSGFAVGGGTAKTASQAYRNAAPEERERLNHVANQNKAKNEVEYNKWLETFTPLQIKEANHARDLLRKAAKARNQRQTYPHIKDDRLVKGPGNAYSLFLKDRFASGDMRRMTVSEAGKLVGREWKGLSESERQPFLDQAAAERNRYLEEYKTVYGIDSPSLKRARK